MSFLMNDSRIDEALKVGFEREKQIKRLKEVPQISEDYVDGQHCYIILCDYRSKALRIRSRESNHGN